MTLNVPNTPERWSKEKCAELAGQISVQQGSLTAFRKQYGGSFLDGSGLARNLAAREITRYQGGTIDEAIDRINNGVGFTVGFAEIGGSAANMHSVTEVAKTSGIVVGGISAVVNIGLSGYAFSQGDRGQALSSAGGAIMDLAGVALTFTPVGALVNTTRTIGGAVIFGALQGSQIYLNRQEIQSVTQHYEAMSTRESGASIDLERNKLEYEKHCNN